MKTDPPDKAPGLLILLASLVALGPLTIDTYLPAMPGMVQSLATTSGQVQLTISSYLLGFSLFHLVCGPLADRFGRRPVLIGGLCLYLLASLACASATSINELIAYRFLQGIAACVGPTLGRAIVRDLYGPRRAARALAHIAMIMALAPALAPTFGGVMLHYLPWPAIFIALAIYATIVLVCTGLRLPESLPQIQPFRLASICRNYLVLLRNRHYMTTTIASAMIYAGMVAFLSASSFVFIDMMGVSSRYFGLLFLTTVAGYIIGNGISTRLAISRASEQVMWLGVQLSVAGGLCMLVFSELWFHPASIVAPMALFAMSQGIVLPHAMGASMRDLPHMAGTASAMFGFVQMGLSAAGGVIMGATLSDSPRPVALAILGCSITAWWLIRRLQRA